MSKIKRIKQLFKDSDIKRFIGFSLVHPMTLFHRVPVPELPEFLKMDDIVSARLDYDKLAIHKLKFEEHPYKIAEYLLEDRINVHLAGIDDEIVLQDIAWFKYYNDPEDVAALHRFLWLYRLVWEKSGWTNQKLNRQIKGIVYDWIDRVEERDKKDLHSEVWQTYSVVERITSWVIMLGLTEPEDDPDKKITDSIIRQLAHIQKNFEYYGDKFTSNHFLNDGRGLYIAGAVLNHEKYKSLGKKIIRGMLERIVPDQVFLREGSSHYQFLITKWLCDCLWIARECKDIEFEEWLQPRLAGMMSGCKYFLIGKDENWRIPLIGDISPDHYPDWIMGVPWVANYLLKKTVFSGVPKTPGYHSILPENIRIDADRINQSKGNNDWGKIRSECFTVFSHVNNSLYPNNLTGHFHHDSGGIVAYVDQRPLLIDCGRANYDAAGVGDWEKSYRGHNLCVVDNNNPEPDMRSFYTEQYINAYFDQSPVIYCGADYIRTIMKNVKRMGCLECQSRIVRLKGSGIVIEDKIEGTGTHTIMLIFHVADIWEVCVEDGIAEIKNGHDKYIIKTSGLSYRLASNDGNKSFYGFYTDEYGALKRCSTILGETKITTPYSILTVIERA